MKEIEILVELKSSIEEAKKALSRYDYQGSKNTIDIYYYDPLRPNLKLDSNGKLFESLRIREKSSKISIAYKVDKYKDNEWLYSDEFETEVADLNSMVKIFNQIGLKELVKIKNTKHTYLSEKFEIVIEEVEDLGRFLEIEYVGKLKGTTDEYVSIKKQLLNFINNVGLEIGEELNSGKPELMLNKQVFSI